MKIERPHLTEQEAERTDLLKQFECSLVEGCSFKNQILSGASIDDLEIERCIFRNCRFLGCTFPKISVWDSSFQNCDFSNCRMEEGYFQRVEWIDCKLVGMVSYQSTIQNGYLKDCNCQYLNLSGARIKTVGFNHCDCSGALFQQWDRKSLSFYETKLTGCNFFQTPLHDLDLSSCSIEGVLLSGEELRGVTIAAHQAQDLVGLLGVKVK